MSIKDAALDILIRPYQKTIARAIIADVVDATPNLSKITRTCRIVVGIANKDIEDSANHFLDYLLSKTPFIGDSLSTLYPANTINTLRHEEKK